MSTPDNYRIHDIRKATVNNVSVKIFTAWRRHGDGYVRAGMYSAPVRTADKDLWKFIDLATE